MNNQQTEALLAVRRCAETIKPRGSDEFVDGVSVAVRMLITHIDWLLEQVQAGHQIPFQVQHSAEWPFEARVTPEPRLLPPQSDQASPDDVRRAVARLSQALGHPKEVEALEGQSLEAALIDMAACRLMMAELLAGAPEAPAQGERKREAFQAGYEAAQSDAQVCDLPPFGWRCTRTAGHDGPCAAIEAPEDVAFVERGMDRLRETDAAPEAPAEAKQAAEPVRDERAEFERALSGKPEVRFWNTTDAMFWAWQTALTNTEQP